MKRILIFGATSKIAEELAVLYAREGADFVLVARHSSRLNSIAERLREKGAAAIKTREQDFLELAQLKGLVDELWTHSSGFDLVLIAHGLLGPDPDSHWTCDELCQSASANLLSQVLIAEASCEKFKKQRNGTLAVLTSVAGERGRAANYLYGAMKSGLITALSGMRNRFSGLGFTIMDLRVGQVKTPMTENSAQGLLFVLPEVAAKSLKRAIQVQKDVAYIPGFWRWILLIYRWIPEFIFKRLRL